MASSFRRKALGVAAAALLLAVAGAASAQPSAADKETARSLMQEARDLRDKGHTQEALKRFKGADDIMHVPTTGLEVAKTQAAMGMLVEARDTIANIRKLPTSPSDPAPFQDARAKADELDTALEGRIPALNITVTGAGEGETPSLVIDGVPVPAAALGLPRRVNPGKHMVVAKAASGRGEKSVDVKEGEQKDVAVTLTASSEANASDTETSTTQPPPGDQAADNGPPKSHSPTLLTWIGAGVGGAGLVAGSITGIMSMSLTSKLKTECPSMSCVSGTPGGNDYASAGSLGIVADVTFALAGVGAAVAVASLIIGHSEESAKKPEGAPAPAGGDAPADPGAAPPASPESRLRVVPWVGPGSAGLVGVF